MHGVRTRLAQIDVELHNDDDSFFNELKIQYEILRGSLRRNLSIWTFMIYEFVKVCVRIAIFSAILRRNTRELKSTYFSSVKKIQEKSLLGQMGCHPLMTENIDMSLIKILPSYLRFSISISRAVEKGIFDRNWISFAYIMNVKDTTTTADSKVLIGSPSY